MANGIGANELSFVVEIEKLIYGGRGLGRCNGRVVLVPFVLPGERVTVEAERESPDLIEARPLAIEELASWRAEALCPYFARCGGCHYQHIPYERQLDFKRGILLETLARIGKINWTGPVGIFSSEPWAYRNRTQLHARKQGRRFEMGYLRAGSRRLEPVDFCSISSPALNRAIARLEIMGADPRFPDFLNQIELFTNERDLRMNVLESGRPVARRFFDWCASELEGFAASSALDYPVAGDSLRVSSRSFFQVNRFLVERIREIAVGEEHGATALDLYAGVGLFSLPLAQRFGRVVAVDSSLSAVGDLECNAARAGLFIETHRSAVEEFLSLFEGPVDFILADPPRAGLGRGVTDAIARLAPRRMTIVSCDPATLARDLRALISAGFEVISLKLVDLFPQTFHIESAVSLARP